MSDTKQYLVYMMHLILADERTL